VASTAGAADDHAVAPRRAAGAAPWDGGRSADPDGRQPHDWQLLPRLKLSSWPRSFTVSPPGDEDLEGVSKVLIPWQMDQLSLDR
jgi:hypothetical protein